jgi:hypothetical protein
VKLKQGFPAPAPGTKVFLHPYLVANLHGLIDVALSIFNHLGFILLFATGKKHQNCRDHCQDHYLNHYISFHGII